MRTVIEHRYENLQTVLQEGKEGESLFAVFFEKHRLHIRIFCLDADIRQLSKWLNTDTAKRFWDADNSIEHLSGLYGDIIQNPHTISLIIELDNKALCLIDVYIVMHDALNGYIHAGENDYGIHFLMAPADMKIKNLSVCCMQQCLRFLFSFKEVETIYGEPDSSNLKANALVQKAGFTFLKRQQLSYKTANIYTCTRTAFSKQILYSLP